MNFSIKFILLFILFPIFCAAQKMDTKDNVKAMFENPSDIQWIKHYKGRIDDLNDVSVTLAFDGEDCKGQITYLRSHTEFDLLGKIENRQLLLHEIDNSKKLSGSIIGIITGKIITGNWNNFDGSKGGNLLLTETEKEIDFPSYCGDNKWVRKYNGIICL